MTTKQTETVTCYKCGDRLTYHIWWDNACPKDPDGLHQVRREQFERMIND